jgi:hypothetical protein
LADVGQARLISLRRTISLLGYSYLLTSNTRTELEIWELIEYFIKEIVFLFEDKHMAGLLTQPTHPAIMHFFKEGI